MAVVVDDRRRWRERGYGQSRIPPSALAGTAPSLRARHPAGRGPRQRELGPGYQRPPRMTRCTCRSSSSSTRSARCPASRRPRSVTPMQGQRLARGRGHRARQRDARPGHVPHRRIERDHRAGEVPAVGQHAAVAVDDARQAAEEARPRGRAAERDAVAHQDQPVRRLGPQDERPQRLGHVVPVRDQLDVGVVLEERGNDEPRGAVVDAGHRVEQVRRRARAGGVAGPPLFDRRRGVAQRGRHAPCAQPADEVERPRDFRGDRGDPQPVDERLEVRGRDLRRHRDVGRVLGALLGPG